jgi:methionyl-tRNA formyltransferase|tara:strand:- start:115 stop:807 length:693 start_codon:yes stop_codon:yes gene_type:complete
MNIGVFAYNFPHWKTQEGINNLIISGNKPKVIFASDPVKLNFYKSKIRITPKDLYLTHPKEIARQHGIDYKILIHNSEETNNQVKEYNLDLGIILGARILKPIAFENFTIGVLNMHPGLLPKNRGLDNIKWAILDNIPQGVTTHLIDKSIDRGKSILKEEIKIYKDDSLVDLNIRIQNLEQKLMVDSITSLKENIPTQILGEGTYYKSVPEDIEKTLHQKFIEYKNKNGK